MSRSKSILILILTLLLLLNLYLKHKNCIISTFTRSVPSYNRNNLKYIPVHKNRNGLPTTIVLAIVVCVLQRKFDHREEAAVLLKSIIISAKLNKINSIEIYFFFENVTRESSFILEKLKEYGYPFEDLMLNFTFKSALEATPITFRDDFLFSNKLDAKRCSNVRLFFPSDLPTVDSILYLDTDILVHGNLEKLWQVWGLMNEKQLIGASSDYWPVKPKRVKVIPHPSPDFLNAGVLLMNLTRMREYEWESKIINVWFDIDRMQPRININDQERINVLLFYNPDLLYRLPCHLNYMRWYCTLNMCESATKYGIELIHGNAESFVWPGIFSNVYLAYQNMNLSNFNFKSTEEFKIYLRESIERFEKISLSYDPVKYYTSVCSSVLRQLL